MTRFRHYNSQEAHARLRAPSGENLDADRAFQEMGRSWWRETALYQWCAWLAMCTYDYATAAFIFAALPFQLLAQVCITHALRALGPQAGAKWLVRGARLGVGSWLGWRGLVVLYQLFVVYVGFLELRWYWIPPMLSYVAFVNGWPMLVMYNIRLMTSEEKNWDEDSVDSRAAAGFAPEALLEHGLAPVLQLYLTGHACGRSGLQEAMRTAHHLAIPKTVDYDYTAACLALADAGVVEALRHIHDTATIWVRQQHARLTLNAIESATNSALGRRLRRERDQQAAERPAARAGTSRGADARRAAEDDLARQEAAAEKAARSLLAEEENNAKKKKPKAPAPKKKKGKKGPPGRARGATRAASAPAAVASTPSSTRRRWCASHHRICGTRLRSLGAPFLPTRCTRRTRPLARASTPHVRAGPVRGAHRLRTALP